MAHPAEKDALRDLRSRLVRANDALLGMKHQTERITGKAEGVRLALSYVDEALRTSVFPPEVGNEAKVDLDQYLQQYDAQPGTGTTVIPPEEGKG